MTNRPLISPSSQPARHFGRFVFPFVEALLIGLSACAGPVGMPMAPISPQALSVSASSNGTLLNRVMAQGSGGMDLSLGKPRPDGGRQGQLFMPHQSLDLSYFRSFRNAPAEFGFTAYATNVWTIDPAGSGFGLTFRRRKTNKRGNVYAPSVTLGTSWFDVNVAFAKKLRPKLWAHYVVGTRLSWRTVPLYGFAGLHYQFNDRIGVQAMVGLQYHLMVITLLRHHEMDLRESGPPPKVRGYPTENGLSSQEYSLRVFSPQASIGPVLRF